MAPPVDAGGVMPGVGKHVDIHVQGHVQPQEKHTHVWI